jgi:hypothetical protein
VNINLPEQQKDYLSRTFLERVRRSYKLALAKADPQHGRIWDTIDRRRAPVHAALFAETDDDLRNIFANPISSDLFLGVDYLCLSVLGQLPPVSQPSEQTKASLTVIAGEPVRAFDEDAIADHFHRVTSAKLFLLAQASGVDTSDRISFDHEHALRHADKLVGQTVLFPGFPGERGLATTRGVASYRAIVALYQTWRVLNFLVECTEKSVVEIGPGVGRTAYYTYCAGVTDYTTVDLPMGMVAQACFLGAALGPDKIWMPGDHEELAKGRIKLLVVGNLHDRTYGLALNVDSITEMSFSAALAYVKWIRHHSQLFLSINHDVNLFTVDQISAKWFDLIERRPYAMQDGYMEEIFTPKGVQSWLIAWHRLAWHSTRISLRRAASSLYRRM